MNATATLSTARQLAKQIRTTIRQQFPDAYFVAGTGWCGPRWQDAEALEVELKAVR